MDIKGPAPDLKKRIGGSRGGRGAGQFPQEDASADRKELKGGGV